MNRLFVVADDTAIEPAIRFAQRCSSGLNFFALTTDDASIRDAVKQATPDIAILVGTDHAHTAARHARDISDAAPSAVILVLTAGPDGEILDEVCHAAAMACMAMTSEPHHLHNPEPTDPPSHTNPNPNPNPNQTGPTTTTPDPPDADHIAREQQRAARKWLLTPRELEVLHAVAEGHSNAQIGRQLWVTEQTVKFHLSNIYRKMGVSNRTEAMRRGIMRGAVSPPNTTYDPQPQQHTAAIAR
jgi:DNA-binding NarL/FixJ family response regulator